MRTCIKEGMVPCTDCCKVLGIPTKNLTGKIKSGKLRVVDQDIIKSIWKSVSKRRAKKINSYTVNIFPKDTSWFTCKNLTAHGCKDQEGKPEVCKSFKADLSYSKTCKVDSLVFFRTGDL